MDEDKREAQLYVRHQTLVMRMFNKGLTRQEQAELEQVRKELDEIQMKQMFPEGRT